MDAGAAGVTEPLSEAGPRWPILRAGGRARNLCIELLESRLDAYGDRPALRCSANGTWTYRELADRVRRTAARLADEGVRRGDVVVLSAHDSPEWVATFLALARVGAVTALASPRLPPDVHRSVTTALGARLAVTEAAGVVAERRLAPSDLRCTESGPLPLVETRERDACYLLLTSGSTGAPKWAVHSHADIRACVATYGRRVLRLRADDVTASIASLSTSYGLGNSCYFPLAAGASAWIDSDSPDPARLADACVSQGVSVIFGVPTFWGRLARHAVEGRIDPVALADVRLAVSAGEPLPVGVWLAVRRSLGLRLVNGLGSSEASNLYLSDRAGGPRPGTVGWPVPGYAVRVAGGDGRDVEAGREGELWVRGPTVMSGYFDDPAGTGRALKDGWLRTGDLVAMEADGSYAFCGRQGDRFKAGGVWVDPQHVLACVLEEPGVSEAAVVGAPDPTGLTRVVALVAAASDAVDLGERVARRCGACLQREEIPRAILIVPELPMTPTGKARRDEMVAIASRALAESADVAVPT